MSRHSLAQYYAAVSAALRAEDMEVTPGLLVLMAADGYGHEAEELRIEGSWRVPVDLLAARVSLELEFGSATRAGLDREQVGTVGVVAAAADDAVGSVLLAP